MTDKIYFNNFFFNIANSILYKLSFKDDAKFDCLLRGRPNYGFKMAGLLGFMLLKLNYSKAFKVHQNNHRKYLHDILRVKWDDLPKYQNNAVILIDTQDTKNIYTVIIQGCTVS